MNNSTAGISYCTKITYLSYSIVVLYIGIMKVRDFLPQNIAPKPSFYLLCDIKVVLVRHSQAQKWLQINHEPFLQIDMKFLKILI